MDHESHVMPSATTSTLNPHGGPQAAMSVSPSGSGGSPIEQIGKAAKASDKDVSSKKDQLDLREFEKQAQELQENLDRLSKLKGWAIQFDLVPELDRPVIKVIDAETRQVIRQIPSEEMLLMSKRLQSMAQEQGERVSLSGLLFDGQV